MKCRVFLIALTLMLAACGKPQGEQATSSAPASSEASDAFVVRVRIPEKLEPAELESQYGGPLDAALKQRAAGEVTGRGTESGLAAEDRMHEDWVHLEVKLDDAQAGLEVLREELLELEAPEGTMLDYMADDGLRMLVPLWSD